MGTARSQRAKVDSDQRPAMAIAMADGQLFVHGRTSLDEEPKGAERHGRCDAHKDDSHWGSSGFSGNPS
jgi:hypothetical protein